MEFEGLRRSNYIPNLTPLIDIVFLLLIFFMLTSHFIRDESIAIELPKAESGKEIDDDDVLALVVNNRGETLLQGQIIALDKLETQLRLLLQNRDKKSVILRGDRNTNLEQTVALLDIARKAGADTVDIVTLQPK